MKEYPNIKVVQFANGYYGLRTGIIFHTYLELIDLGGFYKKTDMMFANGYCSVDNIEKIKLKYVEYCDMRQNSINQIKNAKKRDKVIPKSLMSEFLK